jgi:hypothetical protein
MTPTDRTPAEPDDDYEAWFAMAEREAYELLFPPQPDSEERGCVDG